MKKRWLTVALIMLSLASFYSCSDDNSTGPADPTVPTVTTTAISAITETTAASGGTITSDGGAEVTARGVCWSTGDTPTITDNVTTDGTGTGSFTSALTGLTSGTPYYFRAYAANSIGTGYGDILSFSTSEPTYQTVTSTFDSDAESWSVSGGGLYYRGADGNPGGFIEFEDNDDQCGYFITPAIFHGDFSIYVQGTLSFDIMNTQDNGGTMLGCYGLIRISSGELSAERNIVPYNTYLDSWTSYTIPMTADEWGVTSEQWASILANVTDIIIYMDTQMDYYDRTGLDNFCLTSPPL